LHFQLARAYNVEFTSLPLLVEEHDGMSIALERHDKPLLLKRLHSYIDNLALSG